MRRAWRTPALLLTLTVSGCADPSESDDEDSVESRLSDLPSVQDVSFSEDVIEEGGNEITEIVVDLEPEPAAEDVAAVIEALIETGSGRNAAYVDSPGASWTSGVEPGRSGIRNADDGSDPQEAAEVLEAGLSLAAELGGEAAIDVDLDPSADDVKTSVTVIPASDSATEVDAAVDAVADDPVLSGTQALVLGQDFPE